MPFRFVCPTHEVCTRGASVYYTDGVLLLFQNFLAQKSVTYSRSKVRLVNGTTEVRREHIVNQRIGCTVQWCQTLDEVRDGDRVLTQRNVPIDLQQTPQKVRCPAQHEDCDNKELVSRRQSITCSPKTMTSVILTLLIFALGITPLELALFDSLSWSGLQIEVLTAVLSARGRQGGRG